MLMRYVGYLATCRLQSLLSWTINESRLANVLLS
ncbi:hypothetical protein IEO21_05361 [Rhodonia placenta]|uniref:Uncharacterized protein n=1 Tax=Rhodonia placenta TaxID=104341 RepID=A0A8H7P253_9APHY|nr:hypothetical protein IEO21_05361 [Postia placenta]